MELWTAFILGLVGSLHCAGMCGPLALAIPGAGSNKVSFWCGRAGYNVGRISSYCLLGLLFGALGQTVALAGFQRWASLIAGTAILLALVPVASRRVRLPAVQAVTLLKSGFSALLRQRTFSALYLLGVLNGFLPCGLVYVACAGALALGSSLLGVTYMLAFGLGTVPMMLGIGLLGAKAQFALRFRLQKFIPVCLALMGALLILRGMSLGIPYLSPDLSLGQGSCCH